jgi:hypothetical protein
VATVSPRLKVIAVALGLVAVTPLPACYTLFMHPRLAQLNYQRPQDNRCQTCHSSEELWYFTHPPTRTPLAGPWGEFYDRPWWFERRWKVEADEKEQAGDGVDSLSTSSGGAPR